MNGMGRVEKELEPVDEGLPSQQMCIGTIIRASCSPFYPGSHSFL
jgi:hypothetical protein